MFIFGVALRMIPWENFITRDGVYLLEADNYEHLRKVTVVLNNFPWFPSYDYYMGFPVGTANITNPFFDLVLAFVVRFLLVFYDGLYAVDKLVAALPPFLASCLPIYIPPWSAGRTTSLRSRSRRRSSFIFTRSH
ncbi:MAG: hypothetical protein HYV23_01040 [Deltaproteobacteria bacterium]|nr:hypothetical protein [Deltaproteobacteria bacterium]